MKPQISKCWNHDVRYYRFQNKLGDYTGLVKPETNWGDVAVLFASALISLWAAVSAIGG
jgi:hypothetical protein